MTPPSSGSRSFAPPRLGEDRATAARWALRDAEARLKEVIRRAESDGPQSIAVEGREAAVVVGIDEWRRLSGEGDDREPLSGAEIVALLQTCPDPDLLVAPERWEQPIVLRDVEL